MKYVERIALMRLYLHSGGDFRQSAITTSISSRQYAGDCRGANCSEPLGLDQGDRQNQADRTWSGSPRGSQL